MRIILILIIILTFSIITNGQIKNIENPNGKNIYYYANGKVSSEGRMINNKPDGLWKSYYPDGKLKSIGIRRSELLDSVWNFYDIKGNISEKINYLDGRKSGYQYSFEYFKNSNDSIVGYIKSQELYLNNLRNGISEFYYPDGMLKTAISYKSGRKDGYTKEFNENGIITMIIIYSDGREVDREIINQYKDSLKNGPWKEFYPNGKLKKEENFNNGQLNGLVKLYDLSGELLKANRYENDTLKDTVVNIESEIDIVEDFYKIRDENGNKIKKSSGGFKNGVPVGVHRTYDSLGRVNSSKMYDRNGILIAKGIVNEEGDKLGDWIYFYPSGEIKSEGAYRSNRRYGEWKYYYEDGKLEQNGFFKRGVPDGIWKWYFEEGLLKREENYRIGLEEGESVEYDEFGVLIAKGSYLEGLKDGKWFYDFYDHTETGNYKGDYRDGIWIYSYKSGQLYYEGDYNQGNPDGKHVYYYKNGKLKKVEYYVFGRKEKNWEYYDYYGTLLKVLTFENDKLIKIDGVTVETE